MSKIGAMIYRLTAIQLIHNHDSNIDTNQTTIPLETGDRSAEQSMESKCNRVTQYDLHIGWKLKKVEVFESLGTLDEEW